MEEAYILKDEEGNYVSDDSISYVKKTKEHKYTFSEFMANGFYTYKTELDAQESILKLREKAKEIGFNKKFNIEKIDMVQIMYKESKIKIPKYPFVSKIISKKELAIA